MVRADAVYAQTVSVPRQTSSKGYYAWVDNVKGIGIILVVLGHVLRGIEKAGIVQKNSALIVVDSIIYSFHMPLFFFVSGLFFHNSLGKRHSDGLIRNKFDTIVYPYIVWSIVQGCIEIILSHYTNSHFRPIELLSIMWTPRDQFWFLYILMMCFVVFIIFESAFVKVNYFLVTIILSVLCVFRDRLHAPFIFDLFLANAVYFSVGILCGKFMVLFEGMCQKYIVFLLVAAFSSQYIFHFFCGFNYTRIGFFSLYLSLISILFIIGISINLENRMGVIKYIGKYSMPIYLIHVIAGSGARIVLHGFFHMNDLYVQTAFGTIVGVFCPIVIYKYANSYGMSALFIMPRSGKPYLAPSSIR
ncbi:acyltransferase family protein [Gluconacetobacter sp. Hr-1-5]|uniref:acyltransferase family protein n=1 Tax=Gluconacetobacter sp. Hr-1-5 TaxID=3395370 RepID=UPI003B528DA5